MDLLDEGLMAHGGLDTWQSFRTLEYDVHKGDHTEHHLIDLHSRRTLQSSDDYRLGFDGTNVWVSPDLSAFSGNPHFSRGLDFYFFAIPFVLADPGTHRENLGPVTINGVAYEAVKISFEPGTGASPDDYYIAHFDPDSHQLKLLLYTVTFRSRMPNENYSARIYETWQQIDGLLLPEKIVSYHWDADNQSLGEQRGETIYSNVTLSTERTDISLFSRPINAEVAPSPQFEEVNE